MPLDACAAIEDRYHRYLAGDWDSLQRWAWVYLHCCILLATALLGYTAARGAYLFTALLLPFPLFYLFRRYTYARPNR